LKPNLTRPDLTQIVVREYVIIEMKQYKHLGKITQIIFTYI
jgi:hypothetical protein